MPKGNATRLSDAKLIKKYFIFSDNENGSSIRVIKINTAIIKAKIMKMMNNILKVCKVFSASKNLLNRPSVPNSLFSELINV